MPLTRKGMKVRRAMRKEYGKAKGDQVFYASAASGRLKGVEKSKRASKLNPPMLKRSGHRMR